MMEKKDGPKKLKEGTWRKRNVYKEDCEKVSTEELLNRRKHLIENSKRSDVNHGIVRAQLNTVNAILKSRGIQV